MGTDMGWLPKRTALIVIDLQKGIVAMPTAPVSSAEVVRNAARLADACRNAGAQVVLVRVTPSADGADALRPAADQSLSVGPKSPEGWADLVQEVGPHAGDLVITKRQWGAFYGTELDLQLRRRGIETLILCGISTNIGVESTARDAYERNYRQIFARDAMAARSAEEHEMSIARIFPRLGQVRTTDQIIAGRSVP